MGGILGDVLGIIGGNRQAKDIANANIAAEHGVLGATGAAQSDIISGLYDISQPRFTIAEGNTNPYVAAGQQGTGALQNYVSNAQTFAPSATTALAGYAAKNPQFQFDPNQYFNSPAYNFQLQQGQNAIQNQESAMGLGSSGNALRDLASYGQGLASTYYNQAFNQAQNTFQTNQNATLQNLNSLYGQQQGNFATNQQASLQNLEALINAGQYGTTEYGKLISGESALNLGGQEALGQTGIQGATTAGNFAVNAGLANAAGTGNMYNNIAGIASGVGGLLTALPMFGGAGFGG